MNTDMIYGKDPRGFQLHRRRVNAGWQTTACNNASRAALNSAARMRPWLLILPALVLPWLTAAQDPPQQAAAASDGKEDVSTPLARGFHKLKLQVNGDKREALVYAPSSAKEQETPVVFVFHGHGGTAQKAVRMFAMHRHWPEAISVYMQGLNTPGGSDPDGKQPGWQHAAGEHDDRDLKFFDQVLDELKRIYRVDAKRVYATGHSNGGGFTYLLWATRGEVFAALAPSASPASAVALDQLKPKPLLHLAGENDPRVPFSKQQHTIDTVRRINRVEENGQPWDTHCTLYRSAAGAPVVVCIHRGKHTVPEAAPALIVKFFKEQPSSK
jgi:polyhydroxybutyrate depolymerase